jgi:hypothetical protein
MAPRWEFLLLQSCHTVAVSLLVSRAKEHRFSVVDKSLELYKFRLRAEAGPESIGGARSTHLG